MRMVSPDAGYQEQQRYARIANQIAEAVDAIVATPVGNDERRLVDHAHEAGRIAARRAIEAVRAACRQHYKRRRFDQLAILRRDAVGLLE
jgi:hypothetical protein